MWDPFALLFALLFGFLILMCKVFGMWIFKEKPKSGLPDGSMWHFPLIGETLGFLKSHKSNSLGFFLQDHCSSYGNVFRSHLFGSPTVVSCDLELYAFILQNEETLFGSSYPKPVHDILGKLSMMLVSGSLHKKLRNVSLSFINASKSSPEFLSYVDSFSLSLIHSWTSLSTPLHFFKEAKKLTFYLMLKNLLSIEPDDPIAENILEEFLTFMKGFVSLPVYFPGTAYSKALKARRRITSILKDATKKREKMMKNARGDFLDEVVQRDNLNDEETVSVLMDLLFAGYETTSGLMALVVYFLAKAPSALQKLREEHQSLRKDGESLNWEDYKKMEFTSHVINEALRCGNLVKFVHRKALKDVKFKEYTIPAGWQVLPIMLATHLDPKLHQSPLEFNPWRWTDPTTNRKVTPFGGGVRICPGAELGKLETAFFLHHFILNFRWKINEEDAPMSCPYLDFKGGLLLELEQIK
ncbi:cytochrome P450 724B1-like [Salvia hispanica]|uniref:cytochrome P450 724B1-like n=1 Tax=Salvia hispanica TaxID=49212 RepID=UPI002009AD15|nr:cytochrome P450 724B1-like [Salvia hispanica]